MQPNQQLEKLASMLSEVNKGNVTAQEALQLFERLAQAIQATRKDLEAKISVSGTQSATSLRRVDESLKNVSQRLSDAITEVRRAAQDSTKKVRDELLSEVRSIRLQIPTIPDFDSDIADLRAQIRNLPKPEKVQKLEAGDNIEIKDGKIHNTNPKITVSPIQPRNPQKGDVWIRL